MVLLINSVLAVSDYQIWRQQIWFFFIYWSTYCVFTHPGHGRNFSGIQCHFPFSPLFICEGHIHIALCARWHITLRWFIQYQPRFLSYFRHAWLVTWDMYVLITIRTARDRKIISHHGMVVTGVRYLSFGTMRYERLLCSRWAIYGGSIIKVECALNGQKWSDKIWTQGYTRTYKKSVV